MTISEIRQRLRMEANDDGATPKKTDAYYNQLIISAIGDLESHMGKLAIRESSYQFVPMRDSYGNIEYEDDAVTPKIDSGIYYNPDDADSHSPSNAIVSKGLSVKTGETTATLETADFLDDFGSRIYESDIAFIKIESDTVTDDDNTASFDVSLDNRESWLSADYSIDIELDDANTTGYIDVSRLPSSYIALKWSLSGATAKVKNTVFWRYYIPKNNLRHYAQDIVELARKRLLQIRLDYAITHQNDPMVINGLMSQISLIDRKYGLDKNSGETLPPASGGYAHTPYKDSRALNKILNPDSNGYEDILINGRIISITNTGIRRTA